MNRIVIRIREEWLSESSRADRVLPRALEAQGIAATRSRVQNWIEEGRVCFVDHTPIHSSFSLELDQEIEIIIPAPRALDLTPDSGPLQILFEDEYLAVINKPRGISVHPSDTDTGVTVVHRLLHHLKSLSSVGGVLRPGIVHRLDKYTSGVLIVSKTDAVHVELAQLFSEHRLERIYWAWCYGSSPKIPRDRGFRLETKIARNPKDRLKMSCDVLVGRSAISDFRKLKEFSVRTFKGPIASLVEAQLHTGRTHQVRVHLNHLASSILGDSLYGVPSQNQPKLKSLPHDVRASVDSLGGQALHARVLGLIHPITGAELRFEGPLPDELTALAQSLEPYVQPNPFSS